MSHAPFHNGPLVPLAAIGDFLANLIMVTILGGLLQLLGAIIPALQASLGGLAGWLATPILVAIVSIFIQITLIIIWAATIHVLTMIWMERKVVARMQDRRGPQLSSFKVDFWTGKFNPFVGFLQQIADALKLVSKENITPAAADKWMFHLAPGVLIAGTVVTLAVFPWSETFVLARVSVSLLFVLAGFSVAPVAILMAGWAQNNKYTVMAGFRAGALMMAYEIPLILSIIAIVVLAGTLDVVELVKVQEAPHPLVPAEGPLAVLQGVIPNWFVLSIPGFLALLVFTLAIFAELERLPFDLPEAEAELVEGWLTEYGGMRFGIVYGMKWLRTLLAAALIVLVFLGGWSGPVLPQEVWFLIKTYAVFIVIVWVTWSLPRIRIDQILAIGWRKLIPFSIFNIFLAALWLIGLRFPLVLAIVALVFAGLISLIFIPRKERVAVVPATEAEGGR
jgi:NADH-quinone oxidoreductase subunit H